MLFFHALKLTWTISRKQECTGTDQPREF